MLKITIQSAGSLLGYIRATRRLLDWVEVDGGILAVFLTPKGEECTALFSDKGWSTPDVEVVD